MAGEDAAKSGNHNARLFRISLNLAKGSLNAYRFALLDDLRTIETWSNTKCDIIGQGGSQHRGERELWVLTCVTWGRGREVSVPSAERSGAWREKIQHSDPKILMIGEFLSNSDKPIFVRSFLQPSSSS